MKDLEVIKINNVRGYQDEQGVAQLNLEDVARGLGFTQIAGSGNEVIRWETIRKYLNEFNIPACWDGEKKLIGKQGLPEYIPENIFYKLCFKAKNETARQFQDLVTDKILPAIRKTGGYIAGQEQLSDSELMAKAVLVAQNTIAEKNKLLAEAYKQIEADSKKVLFANAVTTSKNSILVGELAKILNQMGYDIGEKRLFEWLRNNGYLIRRKGNDYNVPTQKSMDLGLFEIKETTIASNSGTIIKKTSRVTGKGQVYLVNKYAEYANRNT